MTTLNTHMIFVAFSSLLCIAACTTTSQPRNLTKSASTQPDVSDSDFCLLKKLPGKIQEVYELEDSQKEYFADTSLYGKFILMDRMFDHKTKKLLTNSAGFIKDKVSGKIAISEADLVMFIGNIEKNAYADYEISGCGEKYKGGVTIRVFLFDWINSSLLSSYLLDKNSSGEALIFSGTAFQDMDACYGKVSDNYKIRELVALYGAWKDSPALFSKDIDVTGCSK